jgi:Tol biopolymer transport system component
VLPGTEGAAYPFWSPDSAFLGFFADGKLKKIALAGGSPQILCDAPGTRGGAWNSDGVIVFTPGITDALYRVPSAGGLPVPVTKRVPQESHRNPEFVPGEKRFLFTKSGSKDPSESGIYVGSLDGSAPVRLLPDQSSAVYVPDSGGKGYLLFRRGTTLMAQPFDPSTLKLTGEMFPLAQSVPFTANTQTGAFSASHNGILIYRSVNQQSANQEIFWLDRTGKRLDVLSKASGIVAMALSPDERRIALQISDSPGPGDLWLLDVSRGTTSRLTSGGNNNTPIWSPDGNRIVFSSANASSRLGTLYQKQLSGNDPAQALAADAGRNTSPYDWSRDGRFVVFGQANEKSSKRELLLLSMYGDRKPVPYIQTPFNVDFGQISPDGHWMAYNSDESGKNEVYIGAIPANGPATQISIAGGSYPRWRRDGRELFYIDPERRLMSVSIQSGKAIEAGKPQPLFAIAADLTGYWIPYQPSADGQRFLFHDTASGDAPAPMTVVLNWSAGLKK